MIAPVVAFDGEGGSFPTTGVGPGLAAHGRWGSLGVADHRRLAVAAALTAYGVALLGTALAGRLDAWFRWYVVLSLLHIVAGLTVFMLHGGRRITATGIYALGQAVFIGIAGLYLAGGQALGGWDVHSKLSSLVLATNATVAMVVTLLGSTRGKGPAIVLDPVEPSRHLPRLGVFLVVFAGLARFVFSYTQVLRGFAWAGLVLIAVYIGRTWRDRDAMPHGRLWTAVLFAFALAVYDQFFFGGFGRVVIASLVLTLLTIWNCHRPTRGHKVVLIALLPAALFLGSLFGQVRREDDNNISGADGTTFSQVFREGEGIESVYQPLRFMGELAVVMQDPTRDVEFLHGASYATSLIFWVPRVAWEGKPVALGAVYAEVLRPRYAEASGYSIAATSHGEWLINFGYFGFLLQIPFIAGVLFALDRFLIAAPRRLDDDRASHARLGIAATLAGGLLQYQWNNSFVFLARVGQFVALLTVLYVFWRVMAASRGTRST